ALRQPLHLRRGFDGRRHHGRHRHRLHEAGKGAAAGGFRQHPPLACGTRGASELEGLMRTVMAALVLLAAIMPVTAAERMQGDAIRQAFEGNTVSGRYTHGGFFTEYHGTDGRALGHNGWQQNTDACWITRTDDICYYYGPQSNRTVHCFTVEQTDRLYVL